MATFKGITLPDGETYLPEGGGSVPVIDDTWDESLNKNITLESEVQSLAENLNNSNKYSQYFLKLNFSANGTGENQGNIIIKFNGKTCGYFAFNVNLSSSGQYFDVECYEYPVPHIFKISNVNNPRFNLLNVFRQDYFDNDSGVPLGQLSISFVNPYSGTISVALYGKGVIS